MEDFFSPMACDVNVGPYDFRAKIAEHKTNIARIDREIARLRADHDKQYKEWSIQKASIAPISWLPIEVLTTIFLECSGDCHRSLRLTLVCRSWRRIALSAQGLWTRLHIEPNSKRKLAATRTGLQPSGSLPLSITARTGSRFGQKVIDMVLSHANRWQSLKITWESDDSQMPSLIPSCEPHVASGQYVWVPLLEEFELDTQFSDLHRSMDNLVVDDLNVILKNAPKLRSFVWTAQSWWWQEDPIDIHLPWPQLSHLELTYCLSLQDCICMLAQCPLLESCDFPFIRREDPPQPLPESPHLLRCLQRLHMNSLVDMAPFFDSFNMPSLEDVSIQSCPNEMKDEDEEVHLPRWAQTEFVALLRRSSCAHIKRLRFTVAMSESDLIECLHLVDASIENLYVDKANSPFVTGTTLRMLTCSTSEDGMLSYVCPKLETISFMGCLSPPLPDNALADMVESRWRAGCPPSPRLRKSVKTDGNLWHVWLHADRMVIPLVDSRRLKALKEEGCCISMH